MALSQQDVDMHQILRQAPDINAAFLNNQYLILEAVARIKEYGKRSIEWLKQPRKPTSPPNEGM